MDYVKCDICGNLAEKKGLLCFCTRCKKEHIDSENKRHICCEPMHDIEL